MFFCEGCRKDNDWPEGFMRSFGPCEVCGRRANCHDVPSRALPEPKRKAKP
jgi:hypothetical protein